MSPPAWPCLQDPEASPPPWGTQASLAPSPSPASGVFVLYLSLGLVGWDRQEEWALQWGLDHQGGAAARLAVTFPRGGGQGWGHLSSDTCPALRCIVGFIS